MLFVKVSSGEERTPEQIRAENPLVSFPKTIELSHVIDLGYAELIDTPPDFKEGFQYVRDLPRLINDVWTVEYYFIPFEQKLISEVSMRQARLALLQFGHYETIQTAMSQQSAAAQIEWEYATTVSRESHLTSAMIAILSLTEKQVNELFVLASTL